MAFRTFRPPAVAGSFYPAEEHALTAQVQSLLANSTSKGPAPKALIVPHAGYIYSGPVAASAFSRLESVRETIRRVVLLGPSHRVAFSGIAIPTCSAFLTPLGPVEVDEEALQLVMESPSTTLDDRPHATEHALEVQLPFLQAMLDRCRIVPLLLGHVEPEQVADILDVLWGSEETLIVASSDLSHYQPYASAQQTDGETLAKALNLDPSLTPAQACGSGAVNALLLAALRHRLEPEILDARNSGDTAGDRSRVVGYAAVGFFSRPNTVH